MEIWHRIKRYYRRNSFKETLSWLKKEICYQLMILTRKTVNYKNLRLKKDCLAKKSRVFIFAEYPYYHEGSNTRSAKQANTLNDEGFAVCYIYAFKSIDHDFYKKDLPLVMHLPFKKLSKKRFEKMLSSKDIIIFEIPYAKYFPYLEKALEANSRVIYEHTNNWESILGNRFFQKSVLFKMIRFSHVLQATSLPLVNQLQEYAKKVNVETQIRLVPNGVDISIIDDVQNEQSKDKVTLLYYGSLYEELIDWDLITNLAINNPDYVINIIGNTFGQKSRIKNMPNNIYFLGEKKYTDILNYIKYTDYVIIPYQINDISNYLSIIEVNDALVMGKQVISVKLPNLNDIPNVYQGNDFASIINSNYKNDLLSSATYVNNHTWVNNLRDTLLLRHVNYNEKISIIVLDNKKNMKKCLNSLLEYKNRYHYDIILLTLNETIIDQYKHRVKIIKEKNNVKGRSRAVKEASGEYLLFLEGDSYPVHEFFLDSYLEILEWDSKVGIINYLKNQKLKPNVLATKKIKELNLNGLLIRKKIYPLIQGKHLTNIDLLVKIRYAKYEIYGSSYLKITNISK